MTRTIVCFGDSNTYGADPGGGERFARDVRWPGVMRAALGDGFEVIEEGLGGRATVFESPLQPHRNGSTYLTPCLLSHAPVDLVILMLGTNDLKTTYHVSAQEIAGGCGVLVDMAHQSLAGPAGTPPRVLLVAPVPVREPTETSLAWGFEGMQAKSEQLAPLYRLVAKQRGAAFLDAGTVASVSPLDSVHLDPPAHASLGSAIAAAVRSALEG